MAKTTFVDGTSTIWASFMNSIFNTDGGHKHDGGTDDGSAGKIDPATETDWGTNAAAPSKSTDTASRVEWSLSHAAAGAFKLVVDHLGLSTLSPKSGDLIVVSDNTGLNFKDLKGRDLLFETLDMASGPTLKVIATSIAKLWNDTETAMATLQANISGETVSATGDVTIGGESVNDRLPVVLARIAGTTVNEDATGAISSVTNPSAGTYRINLASAVSSVSMPVLITPIGSAQRIPYASWVGTSTLECIFTNTSGTGASVNAFTIVIWDF